MDNPCIIFVYNAYSSFFSMILDAVHKTVAPKTYQCNLCGLTYGSVSMKKEWKEFINTLPCSVHFLHRDEFTKQYPAFASLSFPAAFSIKDKNVQELISAEEINRQKSLEELKRLVKEKLL